MRRRTILQAMAAVPLVSRPAWADTAYPTKPIRMIVGYASGGTADVSMRILAPRLSERLGQPVVVENRPGAGGIAASQAVLNAPADGYTLVLAATGNFGISPVLFKSLPFDPVKDFQMVAQAATFDHVFAVRADSKFKTMRDLIGYAKAQPGKLNIGTVQVGSAQYFAVELFKSMAGITVTTVPYRTTGDVLSAVRGGDCDVIVETIAPLVGQLHAGVLRALAISGEDVFPSLPGVPTVAKSGLPGYVLASWNGLAARAGTPAAAVARLDREIAVVLAMDDVKKRFIDLGMTAQYAGPQALRATMLADIKRWGEVMASAHMEKQ